MNKEESKELIRKLIDKYSQVLSEDKVGKYNEEMTKKGFIEPLFRALGWNIEDGDEVTVEERVSKGRVDYGFRIGGIPKFFLEAKALKSDLEDKRYIEQAINYAWHKGCTWAILTDFSEVKVYNAEWKFANPLQNLFFSLSASDYYSRFDQLWLLSKESLNSGSLDMEAEKWGKKSKKVPVDKQLLSDLTIFRELLTKNVLKQNTAKNLTSDELDESVQRIIDRLIFIRTIEDKQLEPPMLQSIIREDTNKRIYKKLNAIFRNLDNIYNSKLFIQHFCEDLEIDDDILEKVIKGLFNSNDNTVHYDFSAIDADVLGNIYEQYLGHILKKTDKRAKLSEGKAHRKEQGIYYTPTYIVDYIVKNTIGELAKDKKFDLKNIKILDPACGSGSFLMKAFDYLVDLDKKKNGEVDQTKLDLTGASATYGTKVEILKNNIFGVDLDPKAVEIAQLNLLLKAAEKKHRLPTLQENIKVGNSLIDDSNVAGNQAFKWEEEFKEIINNECFDVVIGNPPYVFSRNFIPEEHKNYYSKKFDSFEYQSDLYVLFLEKAIKLTREGGFIGFITPNAWFGNIRSTQIRKLVLDNTNIIQIVYCPKETFNIGVETAIIILKKSKIKSKREISVYEYHNQKLLLIGKTSQRDYMIPEENKFSFKITKSNKKLIEKIEINTEPLEKKCIITRGVNAYDKYRGQSENTIKNRAYHSEYKVDDSYSAELKGKNISRYTYNWDGKSWIKYGKWLAAPREPKFFTGERIILRQIPSDRLIATIIKEDFIIDQTIFIAIPKKENKELYFLLGLINSSLIGYYFKYKNEETDEVFPKVKLEQFKNLPIKKTSEVNIENISILVKNIISVTNKVSQIRSKQTDEKVRLEKEIQKLDNEIDEEVYKLYGITYEEKKFINENLSK